MDEINQLYTELKKNKEDYVFSGINSDIINKLLKYCPSNQDTLFWFLGGPLLWIFSWRAKNRQFKEENISKVERKIIACLSNYDCSFKNEYCVLIRKNL